MYYREQVGVLDVGLTLRCSRGQAGVLSGGFPDVFLASGWVFGEALRRHACTVDVNKYILFPPTGLENGLAIAQCATNKTRKLASMHPKILFIPGDLRQEDSPESFSASSTNQSGTHTFKMVYQTCADRDSTARIEHRPSLSHS